MQRDKALQSRVKKAKCSNTKIERVRERRKQSVATQRYKDRMKKAKL